MLQCKAIVSLNKIIQSLGKVSNYMASFFLLLLMMLISEHVLGRYFFNQPLPGAVELIQYVMVCVGSLGFAYCAAQHGHVRVELLVERLPLKIKGVIKYLSLFFSVGIVFFIAWQSVVQAINIWLSGAVSGVLRIPQLPFIIVLAFAYVLFAVELALQLFQPADVDYRGETK